MCRQPWRTSGNRLSAADGRKTQKSCIRYPVLAVSAYVIAVAGRADEARRILSELFGADAVDLAYPYEGCTDCVLAAELVGRRDQARQWLSTRRDLPWFVAARALADQEFMAAADSLDSMGAARSAAIARLRAAHEFVKTGRPAEADDQLRNALGFFRSVGATRFTREADALMAASA